MKRDLEKLLETLLKEKEMFESFNGRVPNEKYEGSIITYGRVIKALQLMLENELLRGA